MAFQMLRFGESPLTIETFFRQNWTLRMTALLFKLLRCVCSRRHSSKEGVWGQIFCSYRETWARSASTTLIAHSRSDPVV
jgi:hypothetical protein